MREVFRAMSSFETAFEKVYRITLNEAMILCILKDATERMTATNLSKSTDLSPSHTSKMLRILEEKGLIVRELGNEDRRQCTFTCLQQANNGLANWKLTRWKCRNC